MTNKAITLMILVLASQPAAAEKVKCSADQGTHSYWREVDGKRCWYAGRRMPKSDLYWEEEPPPPAPEPPRVGEFERSWRDILTDFAWPRFGSDPDPASGWRR